jgi:hypothetical protein
MKLELANAQVCFVCTSHAEEYTGCRSVVDEKWNLSNEGKEIGNINNGYEISRFTIKIENLFSSFQKIDWSH